ncbi:putative Na+/H+ antiporter [Tepidimonas aquatica]|uniref:Putative Na+/H+ antiporter n=1 Tax=Tepidimonas aquatica TaxID=247482 RepID=A0A554WHE2_9BURK|nr:putative Na+/H+ antiporter [Tepidimonas aquatica]TSE22994.1 putative Na+/H+ antiporter [Tepidimonas aquatica]
MSTGAIQWLAAALFALALLHTFSTKFFEHLARTRPAHAGVWHLLGEVEIVFGVWAMLFMVLAAMMVGAAPALQYLDSRNFTEPLFVFAIMVVAGSRPILQAAAAAVDALVRLLPLPRPLAFYFTTLSVVPLLGSFITEPAAMTLAALLMREPIFAQVPSRLKYATLGALFVNVSIGGTLTPFAAPPVLMVAAKWGFDLPYMLFNIGWKAALAVVINAAVLTVLNARTLRGLTVAVESPYRGVPAGMVAVHVVFLTLIVLLSHHPAAFLSVFLLFMGVATAYPQYQSRLILREGLLVAFFLGGLVVLGGMQQWWLQPLLQAMSDTQVYFGATLLTAITDNAALTYLGSLVDGLSDDFKYSLVTGAVSGGGLTVIANAPNPAGAAILKSAFREGAISPKGLFLGALGPTAVAVLCFRLLPH